MKIKSGYKLVRINQNTLIEVKKNIPDIEAKEKFIKRISKRSI